MVLCTTPNTPKPSKKEDQKKIKNDNDQSSKQYSKYTINQSADVRNVMVAWQDSLLEPLGGSSHQPKMSWYRTLPNRIENPSFHCD